jgi:hypothetical protein
VTKQPSDATREVDGLVLVAVLSEAADPATLGAGFRQALRDAYWTKRDLGLVVTIAHAGFGATMAAAAREPDDTRAHALRSDAKALCYDLASFTWRGWGEPDLEIAPGQEAAGLDAAHENLRLARCLGRGDLPESRALWMLGAQLLSAGDHPGARAHFVEAAVAAQRAGAADEAALAETFAALVDVLADEPGASERLERRLSDLRSSETGEAFAGQVTTAFAVFAD